MELNEIARSVRTLVSKLPGSGRLAELIELYSRIVEEAVSKWEAGRFGRRFFPCNRISIRLYAHDAARAAAMEQMFGGDSGIGAEIRTTLQRLDCEIPQGFLVHVDLVRENLPEFAGNGYVLEFSQAEVRETPASQVLPVAATPRHARLTVVRGQAAQAAFEIASESVNLGRLSEVEQRLGGIQRRNNVAFCEDGTPVNLSVSRRHAHIDWDPEAGAHILYQDRREARVFTRILRCGRSYSVGALGRGMRLQSGDEIHLGQAVLRYEHVPRGEQLTALPPTA